MRLGRILRRYRIVEERTIRDIAKEAGVNHATWLRLEQGKDVSMHTFTKVFRWLTDEDERDAP